MKYAKFSDDFLSDFRLDDNGETLVLTDKRGYTRAVKLLNYEEKSQGEWIRYRDNPHQPEHIKCSNCGQYWSIADHDKTFDFCFKCGADMRGGENHD